CARTAVPIGRNSTINDARAMAHIGPHFRREQAGNIVQLFNSLLGKEERMRMTKALLLALGLKVKGPCSETVVRAAATQLGYTLVFAAVAANCCWAQLSSFGYGRMTMNGAPALGGRPLVVMLSQYEGFPALTHDAAYFDQLVFNYSRKSANGFFLENSHGRF